MGYNAVMKHQFSLRRLFFWLTAICVICAFPMLAAMLGVVALAIVITASIGAIAVGLSFLVAFVGVLLVTRFGDKGNKGSYRWKARVSADARR